MLRSPKILVLGVFLSIQFCFAQDKKQLDSLCAICKKAVSDSDQVIALNNLANFFYINRMEREGDSVLQEQLHVAEISNNSNLILKTYFDNSVSNIAAWTTTQNFEKAINFTQQGLDYAYSQNAYDYIVRGHIVLAMIYRKKLELDKAQYNVLKGLSYLEYLQSDSIKAALYIELGDVYQAKGEAVLACSNYNNAFDIAIKSSSPAIESQVYRRLADLYSSLNDSTQAKRELLKSLDINIKTSSREGMIEDYMHLARITDDPYYINKAIRLADSIHFDKQRLRAKYIMLSYYMVKVKNSDAAINYINTQPDLKRDMFSNGMSSYYFWFAEIYRYANNPDSALYYFNLSKNDLLKDFDKGNVQYFYLEMAVCYALKNDTKNAVDNYQQALRLSRELQDTTTASIADALSLLYQIQGDYKNAYTYKLLATGTKDSLQKLAKDRDLALLGIARENSIHEEAIKDEQEKFIQKRNVQYMGITIAIGVVFVLMLFLGMFPVSPFTIRILGFFFFISLFEFIVLLIDSLYLTHKVHNEPFKLWVIKIGLIALLVPFQHFLEHGLTKFLTSRKLYKMRSKFSFKKMWNKLKKPPRRVNKNLKEDTAVL